MTRFYFIQTLPAFLFLMGEVLLARDSDMQLPDTLTLDEVSVTSSKVAVNRSLAPLSISCVDEQELEASSESALLPILSEAIPGLFVTQRGVTGFGVAEGAAGQISIRGVGGAPTSQVLVLINGSPQYMGIMGHPLADSYMNSGVERVEVIRGPASMLYGSNAMGGVINIITKEPYKEGVYGKVSAQYGSFNTAKLMAHAGGKYRKLGWNAGVSYDRTDGHRDSSDFQNLNTTLKGSYQLNSNVKLFSDVFLTWFEAQDPGMEDAVAGKRIDIFRGMLNVGLENNYNKTEGVLRFFRNFGEHNISDGFHSHDFNYGATLYQTIHLWNGNSTTVGGDFKQIGGMAENTLAMNGQGLQFVDTALYEAAGYILMQQDIFSNRLKLNAGFRMDYQSLVGEERVPMAGVSFRATENTVLKASVAKGFRNPTIRELYMWGNANDQLLAENMINYELGGIHHFLDNQIKAELSVFYAEGKNLIQTQFISGSPRYSNTGIFYRKGMELAGSYQISNFLHMSANYSGILLNAPVLATPEQQLYVSLNYRKRKFSGRLSTQYTHNLYTDISDDLQNKESYILVNAGIDYQFTPWMKLFFKADNLLNKSYVINTGYPMPGILIFTGASLTL